MINIIKEFLLYREMIKSFQKIELQDSEKIKLETFDKDLLKKIINLSLENLYREMLSWDLKEEYVRWYKHWLIHLLTYFKKYIITNK